MEDRVHASHRPDMQDYSSERYPAGVVHSSAAFTQAGQNKVGKEKSTSSLQTNKPNLQKWRRCKRSILFYSR